MQLAINKSAVIDWQSIEGTSSEVLVVDEFLSNAEEVKDLALSLEYRVPSHGDFYPGVKSTVALSGASEIVRWISSLVLKKMYGGNEFPREIDISHLSSPCTFAVVAIDRDNLPANFSDQHVDGQNWLASVINLSRDSDGRGTAFWEHRTSGLSSWVHADPIQLAKFESILGLDLTSQVQRAISKEPFMKAEDVYQAFRRKSKRAPLSLEESEQWKLLHFVPAKFNRLVVYPTWLLHSIVDSANYTGLNVDNMRMTMNQFIGFPFVQGAESRKRTYPESFYSFVDGLSILQ